MKDKHYKAIMFDLDGTLLDTMDGAIKAINEAVIKTGGTLQYDRVSMLEIMSFVASEMAYFTGDKMGYSEEKKEELLKLFLAKIEPYQTKYSTYYPGMTELLPKLKEAGYLVFVVTNKEINFANRFLNNKFEFKFDYIMGEIIGKPKKPDPFMVEFLCDKYSLDKKDVLYVGDSDVDIATAINSKIDLALMTYGFGDYSKEKLAKCDYVLNSVKELEELLLK